MRGHVATPPIRSALPRVLRHEEPPLLASGRRQPRRDWQIQHGPHRHPRHQGLRPHRLAHYQGQARRLHGHAQPARAFGLGDPCQIARAQADAEGVCQQPPSSHRPCLQDRRGRQGGGRQLDLRALRDHARRRQDEARPHLRRRGRAHAQQASRGGSGQLRLHQRPQDQDGQRKAARLLPSAQRPRLLRQVRLQDRQPGSVPLSQRPRPKCQVPQQDLRACVGGRQHPRV
ncbi:hypothetical protein Golomagni_06841 [Golovinomyces magnicellulatus]|nr:hypothetical protein Golomagni_06841 [Golovinomyces magnicellulatus]